MDLHTLLTSLQSRHLHLALRRDLSKEPKIFGHTLRIKGLYLWNRAQSPESLIISQNEWEVILFNETDPQRIPHLEGYYFFRLYDLQEFLYCALIRPFP